MPIEVDYSNLLIEKMKSGINIFTGAGFSILPDEDGKKLLTAPELCVRICQEFKLTSSYNNDLEMLSTMVRTKYKQRYQQFLRDIFTIEKYNLKYDVINKICIKSYITTNIDNIIQCVMDKSPKYYLNNITQYGASRKNKGEIKYIPLHGDVNNTDNQLYFGKFDLATVDTVNRDLFEIMFAEIMHAPTLFWGYGFHDDGVTKVLTRVLGKCQHEIWVQCRKDDPKIELFKNLGCHIIIADTAELLEWIDQNVKEKDVVNDINVREDLLSDYLIPTLNKLKSAIPVDEFYLNSKTNWFSIIADKAYEGNIVTEVKNEIITHKNFVLIGIQFSGKTTCLMQLALKVDAPFKLFVSNLTIEKAKYIINNLNGSEALIFIDDFADDMLAYHRLAKEPNIKTIASTEIFSFESAKHLISDLSIKKVVIGDISQTEAQSIFEKIPLAIRMQNFKYKHSDKERFGMLEMMANNVKNIISEERIRGMLNVIKAKDVFETIILTCYLYFHKSALSIDVLFSYFDNSTYENITYLTECAQQYLSDLDVEFLPNEGTQDYYVLRSKLFAYHANNLLLKDFKSDYARVLRIFFNKVSPYKIYNYYVFKRRAYDAEFFFRLFGKDANNIYEKIYAYEDNPYTLQQWALYKSKTGDFKGAFLNIDTAISYMPLNFSIKNSRAIILFEANRNYKTAEAISGMQTAMSILEECFNSDKRKIYHAQKYAEFALFFFERLNRDVYLETAWKWIKLLVDSKESSSPKTMELYDKLKKGLNE